MSAIVEFFRQLSLETFAVRGLPAAVILAVTILLGRWASRLVRALVRRMPAAGADATVEDLAGRTVLWSVWLFGAIAALGALAIAIGLGLKDTLSNVAAGLEIIFLRPIAVGEFIAYRNPSDPRASGTVTRVGLFSTQLRTVEGLYVSIPNRLLLLRRSLRLIRNRRVSPSPRPNPLLRINLRLIMSLQRLRTKSPQRRQLKTKGKLQSRPRPSPKVRRSRYRPFR